MSVDKKRGKYEGKSVVPCLKLLLLQSANTLSLVERFGEQNIERMDSHFQRFSRRHVAEEIKLLPQSTPYYTSMLACHNDIGAESITFSGICVTLKNCRTSKPIGRPCIQAKGFTRRRTLKNTMLLFEIHSVEFVENSNGCEH